VREIAWTKINRALLSVLCSCSKWLRQTFIFVRRSGGAFKIGGTFEPEQGIPFSAGITAHWCLALGPIERARVMLHVQQIGKFVAVFRGSARSDVHPVGTPRLSHPAVAAV